MVISSRKRSRSNVSSGGALRLLPKAARACVRSSCHSVPQSFLVRRKSTKINLVKYTRGILPQCMENYYEPRSGKRKTKIYPGRRRASIFGRCEVAPTHRLPIEWRVAIASSSKPQLQKNACRIFEVGYPNSAATRLYRFGRSTAQYSGVARQARCKACSSRKHASHLDADAEIPAAGRPLALIGPENVRR
jgi:hypothetical protein